MDSPTYCDETNGLMGTAPREPALGVSRELSIEDSRARSGSSTSGGSMAVDAFSWSMVLVLARGRYNTKACDSGSGSRAASAQRDGSIIVQAE